MEKLAVALLVLILFAAAVPKDKIQTKELIKDTITIEIKGAVSKTGLLQCMPYSTIQDVLETLQLHENADLSTLNLQTVLKDGDVLVIPSKSEQALVSINTADLETLCTLDGIGPTMAQRIIDYRSEVGLFRKLEDLMNVKGIGEKKFAKIKERICL